jgi:hypothetical protein
MTSAIQKLLLTATLVATPACTVANPIHRSDAGDAGNAEDDRMDAGVPPGPGSKLAPVTCQPNLAYHAAVRVSSSYDGLPGWASGNAVDGKTTFSPGFYGYSSQVGNADNPNQGQWIEIDLGVARIFDSVVLYPRSDPGRVGDGFPIDFTIKVWNGTEWLTRVAQTNYPKPAGSPQIFTWNSRTAASKVLIETTNMPKVDGWYVMQFVEIQISDSMSELNPESNQLLGARVTASSSHEYQDATVSWTSANVVDGNTTAAHSGYSSIFADVGVRMNQHPEWLEVALPCQKALSKIVLYPRNHPGYLDYGFPENFSISLWNGTAWDKKVNETGYKLPGGAAQTFSWGSKYTTDKIRIDANKLRNLEQGWYMFQLAEIEAYP